jgi:conjugative relaxase-like TrwC/TraI family protein
VLRFRDSKSPAAGYHYFSKSDSGLAADGLRSEVGGEGAKALGLDKKPDFDQFKNLLHGLDPNTGEQLTAKLIDGRISYWDITASVPKGVTVALEFGDARIQDLIWDAGREAMKDLEAMTTTRIRKGGEHDDRKSGNLIWYGFEHPETRPARSDNMPDPDRHIHFVIPNLTFDPQEQQWKAIKFRQIYDQRKYFSQRFDHRLAGKLAGLGYEIETKYKSTDKGKKYSSWDIKGIPPTMVEKFSRRTAEVEKLAAELGITNPQSKDKLGATSRQFKRQDMTLADYREYWNGRITDDERSKLAEVVTDAKRGRNPKPENGVEKAVAYAIGHHFERNSVIDRHILEITAMERSMGAGLPDQVLPTAIKQGLLIEGEECTTKEVLAEEGRIIAFAREGKGTMRPLGRASPLQEQVATLSPEQQALCKHMLESSDRMQLKIGGAGTGKTHTVKAAINQVRLPIAMMAPTTSARDVLNEDFPKATTVAAFLVNEEAQQAIKNGVIVCDEFGLLPIEDLGRLCKIATEQNARIIAIGDPKQHLSVVRNGDMFNVLQTHAGLPVAKLQKIRRQTGEYAEVVANIRDGEYDAGVTKLDSMGWVQYTPENDIVRATVDKWLENRAKGWECVISGLTHKQNDAINAAIRERLKETGEISSSERLFHTLKPVPFSESEKGDRDSYNGDEVLVFRRNSGPYKASQTVPITETDVTKYQLRPDHIMVFRNSDIMLAVGDKIRFTKNVTTKAGKLMVNGRTETIAGFTKQGEIILPNKWVVDKDSSRFIDYGHAKTSFKVQGRTDDAVISVMSRHAYGAVNAAQSYVDLSRGRFEATVITDMSQNDLIKAARRENKQKSATELMKPKRRKSRFRYYVDRALSVYHHLRDKRERNEQEEREVRHGRS